MTDFTTKAALLEGFALIKDVEIEGHNFRIRPLTFGEQTKIESITYKGVEATQKGRGGKVELGEQELKLKMDHYTANDWEAKIMTVAFGLSVDKNTKFAPDEIRRLAFPRPILNGLLQEIRTISGMNAEASEDVETFRDE